MNSHVNSKSDQIIEPTQKRGREMQARLVQATLELLENQTFEEISVADITQQAGVAVGTFYRRFTSKEAMLPLLYEAYNRRVSKWFEAVLTDKAFETSDRAVRIRNVVIRIMELCEDNRGLMRAMHLNSRIANRVLPATVDTERHQIYSAIAHLIEPEGPSEHQIKQAQAMVLIVISACVEYVLYPQQTPASFVTLDREELITALSLSASALFA